MVTQRSHLSPLGSIARRVHGHAIATTGLIMMLFLAGCAARGEAWRAIAAKPGQLAGSDQQHSAYYIEGTTPGTKTGGPRTYSCSFVEFDEHGDYLKFEQHEAAKQVILDLARQPTALVLVIYCHGWRNNADSEDVVRFNRFLSRLADGMPVDNDGEKAATPLFRVHGVYLAWRGNSYPAYVDTKSREYTDAAAEFGGGIVNPAYTREFGWPLWLPELSSYWGRKHAAEFTVSGVPLARSVFTFAYAAKTDADLRPPVPRLEVVSGERQANKVYLIGHSFGALMLEKSVGQAIIGSLTAQWPWQTAPTRRTPSEPQANPLPFDSVLFINSAAPSLHSKELSDFLWAHQNSSPYGGATAPVIMSVTSDGDWATGNVHRFVNLDTRFEPSFQRDYQDKNDDKNAIFEPRPGAALPPAVEQSYFYTHTPGHNPLLTEYWVRAAEKPTPDPHHVPNNRQAVIYYNWSKEELNNPAQFYLVDEKHEQGPPLRWEIRKPVDPDDADEKWRQHDFNPWEGRHKGAYWIVRVNKELIHGHSDVWTEPAIDLYTALFRLNDWMRLSEQDKRKAKDAPSWLFGDKPDDH